MPRVKKDINGSTAWARILRYAFDDLGEPITTDELHEYMVDNFPKQALSKRRLGSWLRVTQGIHQRGKTGWRITKEMLDERDYDREPDSE